jgi:CHAT domain-containing protein
MKRSIGQRPLVVTGALCILYILVEATYICSARVDAVPATISISQEREAGIRAFERGDFEQAVESFEKISPLLAQEKRFQDQIDILINLAEAYQGLGQYRKSLKSLNLARGLAEKSNDQVRVAQTLGGLGRIYFLMGSIEEAVKHLDASIALARRSESSAIEAASLNNLGSILTAQGNYSQARVTLMQSAAIAQQIKDPQLEVKALINAAKAALQDKKTGEASNLLVTAYEQSKGLEDSHDKAYQLIALGMISKSLLSDSSKRYVRLETLAYNAFTEATAIAERLGDLRAKSYGWGYLGQLYEEQGRCEEVLTLTHRAIFFAQQANAPDILYQWYRQNGILLRTQGDTEGAISAYRQALYNLQRVRHDLSSSFLHSGSSFRNNIKPIFFELADLLLQRSANTEDPELVQQYLLEARDTIEKFKSAELQDYFQDDCVIALQSRIASIDRLAPDTAAIYPILLPDRIELLLSLSEGIKQFTISVDKDSLTREVRAFRRMLEKRTTREYRPHAENLYRWLIRPLEAELHTHNIRTLVFVPDGPLRTIPIAALYDGEAYLIEQYSIAISPGLTLTDFRPTPRKNIQVLVNGLTKSVGGFPPLHYVSLEMESINEIYSSTVLKDENFLISNFRKELKESPYSIVHIASHGEFTNNADRSFLLTFDGKLTMDRLEQFMSLSQFREEPIELLSLSACQTAAGDDRAALGLAGVAVKAGARSALATLWLINDEASSDLVSEFYRELHDPTQSKAQALQKAQIKLMSNRRYRHPGYWAPFLLIGNWL